MVAGKFYITLAENGGTLMPAWFDYWKENSKDITRQRCAPCYAPVYADPSVNMAVYIPKFDRDIGPDKVNAGQIHAPMGEEFISRQAMLLSKMGFEFEYTADGVMAHAEDYWGVKDAKKPVAAHLWLIKGRENSPLARLFLLNAVRQGHETPMQSVVALMAQHLVGSLTPLQMFNRYLILHHVETPSIHNCIPSGTLLTHTDEEFDEFLHDTKVVYQCNSSMLQVYSNPKGLRKALRADKPWGPIMLEYSKLIGERKADV